MSPRIEDRLRRAEFVIVVVVAAVIALGYLASYLLGS